MGDRSIADIFTHILLEMGDRSIADIFTHILLTYIWGLDHTLILMALYGVCPIYNRV